MIRDKEKKPDFVGGVIQPSDIPILVCSKCHREFRYRGEIDNPGLRGEPVTCNECEAMFSGGPLNGMTVGDMRYDS